VARPTKLTPEARQRIVTAIRAGNYRRPAARSAGISEATFHRWMARGKKASSGVYRDFYEEVERAEADAEVYAVTVIRKAMPNEWRAAAHFLERRYPESWRRRETLEHQGDRRLLVTTEDVSDPKTREELRGITRRIADARKKRPGGARGPD
jgi:hypothetical protein